MENDIAILMADLSGYSALTETHGAVSAADLIDKFMHITEDCLVGDSKLHQRTGDEIMVVSHIPDFLLATTLKLAASIVDEDNFLQVHGGLHFGKVLQRNNHYFGSSVNLASRITARATAGTFWCSDDFVNSITDKSLCTFTSKGKYLFKNISTEKEVFELNIQKTQSGYIDPVCRMLILNTQNALKHPGEEELYFCSSACLEKYKANKKLIE